MYRTVVCDRRMYIWRKERAVRLIDADALIEEMPTVMDMQDAYLPIHFKEWLIDEAPTIEPKRGAWEATTMVDCGASIYLCSVCEYEVTRLSNFCPNCGASMRERDGE